MEKTHSKKIDGPGEKAAPAPRRIDRRRAPETASRILDAAESLFSTRGYYGVSLRDIAAECGVQVALTHYHFKSKEALFGAVIARRAAEHAERLIRSLRQALTATGSKAERRSAIVRAFIEPIVERSVHGGSGWKNYIRLMALVANLPQEQEIVAPFHDHFDGVIAQFTKALHDLHPEMTNPDVQWGFFFYQAATTHILVESGLLERQSDLGLQSRDLEKLVDKLVPFISAGFTGLGAAD